MTTDQPVRCPLCGGYPHDRYRACDNPKCELPVKHWPRIAELVAIRDAAVRLVRWTDMHPHDFDAAMARVTELARQEAKHGK